MLHNDCTACPRRNRAAGKIKKAWCPPYNKSSFWRIQTVDKESIMRRFQTLRKHTQMFGCRLIDMLIFK